jgi:RNA polymerase sigma-70 factor (ECF subfamily)
MDWEEILDEMQLPLYRFALQLVGEPHGAADLAQDTMCRAWENRNKLRNPSAVRPWLFRIAVNLAHDGYRRWQRNSTERLVTDLADTKSVPEEIASTTELHDQVMKAINTLPPRQRQVLHLRVVEELAPQQIADVLSLSSQLVRSNLAAARKQLRQLFSDHDHEPPRTRYWQMSDKICEDFDDYYDGWLVDSARHRYQQHLDGCKVCRDKLRLQRWLDQQMVVAADRLAAPSVLPRRRSKWQRFGRPAASLAVIALVITVIITALPRNPPRDQIGVSTLDQAPAETDDQMVHVPVTTEVRVSVDMESNDFIAIVDQSIEEVTFVRLYPVIHRENKD